MRDNLWLKKPALFQQVYKDGESAATRDFVLVYLLVGNGRRTKIGITISKKIGKAVVRNKIKRRLKSIIKGHSDKIKPGYALVFVGRKAAFSSSFAETKESVIELLVRAGALEDQR